MDCKGKAAAEEKAAREAAEKETISPYCSTEVRVESQRQEFPTRKAHGCSRYESSLELYTSHDGSRSPATKGTYD